tara:strand:- start:435 stop:1004 length:570 start_codon:yes stop_codon:yes gene_type:complete
MEKNQHTGSAEHEFEHTVQSTKTLVKASVFAILLGALALTLFILPAEYDIDPTGAGAALGLTKLAKSAPVSLVKPAAEGSSSEFKEHSAEVIVPAGAGIEYKISVLKGDAIRYSWKSGSDELFFDFHGEPKGDTTGYFQSYTVSTSNQVRGSLTAPFEGSHGWYWENKGSYPITVSLQIEGSYELIDTK